MKEKVSIGLEIERKYIIKMPDLSILAAQECYSESRILQIYLPAPDGETRRIRRRSFADSTAFIETRKIRVDSMSSTEIEREMSEGEFDGLSAAILGGTRPIEKTRHTFVYQGQLFEIDIYPQWRHTAIMETELPTRDTEVKMPPFLNILREVTGNKAYSNASMSRAFPKEETQP